MAESVGPLEMPSVFDHRGPVPGLVNLAQPAFPQVDEFEGCEWNGNAIRRGGLQDPARTAAEAGRLDIAQFGFHPAETQPRLTLRQRGQRGTLRIELTLTLKAHA